MALRRPGTHNVAVEPDELPDPDDLWWSWVVLAALHRATGDAHCRFDVRTRTLRLDSDDGSWLCMQRTLGSRATLWGRSSRAPASVPDPRRSAPDWAVTEATMERRPSFVAWHAHGEWDATSAETDEGAIHLIRPLLTVDPRAVEAAREGAVDPETLSSWTDGDDLEAASELIDLTMVEAGTTYPGGVHTRLRNQIHQQMRDCVEVDRMLMQRPPTLVQWSRASGPGFPFEYAVMVVHGRITPSPTNTHLPAAAVRTLTNVLRALHMEEAAEESGGWLFARVTSDGVVVRFDRAFDSWPTWFRVNHAGQGPALVDLTWEMRQRSEAWRPAWASLLPQA